MDALIEATRIGNLIDHPGPVVDAMIEMVGGGFDRSSRPSGGRSDSGGGRFPNHPGPVVDAMIEINSSC